MICKAVSIIQSRNCLGSLGDEPLVIQSKFKISLAMKKGLHPQMQWVSYVTQSGRLMHVMMTKIHHVGKVYHLKARRQMDENLGQVAKFRQRYEKAAVSTHNQGP